MELRLTSIVVVIILISLVCKLDTLVHLAQGVLEHLCEVTAHLADLLLQPLNLCVLISDHLFFCLNAQILLFF